MTDTDFLPDVMVDVETLGVGPNAMIVQIGAVRFDAFRGEKGYITTLEGSFSFHVTEASKPELDGEVDLDTIRWWMTQGKEAQQRVFHPNLPPSESDIRPVPIRQGGIVEAIGAFDEWLDKGGPLNRIWGNGPQFDLALLKAAYKRVGAAWRVHHRAERCFRTLRWLASGHPDGIFSVEPPPFVGVGHDALDDAYHQAGWAIKILREMDGYITP